MANDTSTTADEPLVFEEVFKAHFKSLHSYAYTIVRDDIIAEEIVQNVFAKLWEKRNDLQITHSIKAYLYRSVYHEGLNYLRHQKIKMAYESHASYHMKESNNTSSSGELMLKELEQKLEKALNELPQQCRTIFQMSRFDELKYREIAEQLGISIKTVENQMGKALKIMRTQLVDYLPILLVIINL